MTAAASIRTALDQSLCRHRGSLVVLALSLLVGQGCAEKVPELPQDAPSALVYTRTLEYRHDNIEVGLEALEREGQRRDTTPPTTTHSIGRPAPH